MIELLEKSAIKTNAIQESYLIALKLSADIVKEEAFLRPALSLSKASHENSNVAAYIATTKPIEHGFCEHENSQALEIAVHSYDGEKTYKVSLCKACVELSCSESNIALIYNYQVKVDRSNTIIAPKGSSSFVASKVYTSPCIELYPEWVSDIDSKDNEGQLALLDCAVKCDAMPQNSIGGHALIDPDHLVQNPLFYDLIKQRRILARFDVTQHLALESDKSLSITILEKHEEQRGSINVIASLALP